VSKDAPRYPIPRGNDGRRLFCSEGTARKVGSYYVPPIAAVETINVDQSMTITQYEVTADIDNIQPQAQIFYELNCSERMTRELSMNLQAKVKNGSFDKPSDWKSSSLNDLLFRGQLLLSPAIRRNRIL
jgi:hypothetical protein